MKIVIDRKTRQVISKPELTQQQSDDLWAEIIRNYVRKHPEVFERVMERDTEKEN